MKVYIVTSGSYSDYHIDRVYLDKEQAEAFVALHNKRHSRDYADVEEYDTSDGTSIAPDALGFYSLLQTPAHDKRPGQ